MQGGSRPKGRGLQVILNLSGQNLQGHEFPGRLRRQFEERTGRACPVESTEICGRPDSFAHDTLGFRPWPRSPRVLPPFHRGDQLIL